MLEKEIKLIEDYISDENSVSSDDLSDASQYVLKLRYALYGLERALDEAVSGYPEFAKIRYDEYKEDMQGEV
jgi:hypothetical protein